MSALRNSLAALRTTGRVLCNMNAPAGLSAVRFYSARIAPSTFETMRSRGITGGISLWQSSGAIKLPAYMRQVPAGLSVSLLSANSVSEEEEQPAEEVETNVADGMQQDEAEGQVSGEGQQEELSGEGGEDGKVVTHDYNARITKAQRSQEYDEVFNICREMKDNNVEPNLITYNSLLAALGGCGNVDGCLKVLDDMKKAPTPISPTVISYNHIIRGCIVSSNKEAAEKCLEKMAEDNIEANSFTYNLFIILNSHLRDLNGAFQQFEAMKQQGIFPTSGVYKSLVRACLLAQSPSRAHEVLLDMERARLDPGVAIYRHALDSALGTDNNDLAVHAFRGLTNINTALDMGTLFKTLSVAARSGDPHLVANEVWSQIAALGENTENPQEVPEEAYSAMVNALGLGGQAVEAFSFAYEMQKKGMKLVPSNIFSLSSSCSSAPEKMDEVYYYLEGKKNEGETVDLALLNCVVRACGMNGDLDRAFATFQEFENFKVTPDRSSYNDLLAACSRCNEPDSAFRVYDQMQNKGITPDIHSYEIMVSLCCKEGDLETALLILDEISSRKMKPSARIMNVVFRRAIWNKDFHKAVRVAKEMRSLDYYIPRHLNRQLDSIKPDRYKNTRRESQDNKEELTNVMSELAGEEMDSVSEEENVQQTEQQ